MNRIGPHLPARWLAFGGSLGILASGLFVIGYSIQVAQPTFASPTVLKWYLIFAACLVGALALTPIRSGRFLLALTLGGLGAFIALTIAFAQTGWAFLMLIWILVLATGLGNQTLARIAPTLAATWLEHWLAAISIGLGLLAFLILALGLLQLLYPLVAYGTLGLITLLFAPGWMRGLGSVRAELVPRALSHWRTTDWRLCALIASWSVLCAWGGLMWALAPSIHFDALMYHLGVPAIYVRAHGIIPVAEEFRSYWAHNAEMLYTLALLIADQPLPGLIHWAMSGLIAGWVYAIGARLGNARVGLIALALFISMPLVTWESGTAYVDLIVTFYVVGAVSATILGWLERDDRWLIIGGIQIGLAVGSKLNAALILTPLILIWLAGLITQRLGARRNMRALIQLGVPALVVLLPWLIRDWVWTGNPIFPFLNAVFASPYFPRENTNFNFAFFGIGRGFSDWLQLPVTLITHTERFSESGVVQLGGVTLLALPWLYFSKRWSWQNFAARLFTFVCAVFLLWFWVVQYLRYLLPILPVLAWLAALNIEALWTHLVSHMRRQVALGIILTLATGYLITTRWIATANQGYVLELYPWRVALGVETPAVFLGRNLSVYSAFQFLNAQADGAHQVATVGIDARLYTHSRIVPFGRLAWLEINPVQNQVGANLSAALLAAQFDYLILDRHAVSIFPYLYADLPLLDETFLAQYAQLEFARQYIEVYHLRAPEMQRPPARNLLRNDGFEKLDGIGMPINWSWQLASQVDQTGTQAHSGTNAIRIDGDAVFDQRVEIEPNRLYTFGCWIRAPQTQNSARLQIRWLDRNSRILEIGQRIDPVEAVWQWRAVSGTAPPNATFAHVSLGAPNDSAAWFDDCRFVQGTQ